MKKVFIYIMTAVLSFGMTSCDKIFDNLEGDLSKMTAENLLSSEAGLKGLLANLYGNIPMGAFSSGDNSTFFANSSRSTPSYGTGGINSWWSYSNMRSINKFIEALDSAVEKKIITEDNYKTYKGEALFIRAYCYFGGVTAYGGMPIVETSLDDKYDGKENAGLYIPRSTEKATYDWIIAQLGEAASLMPEVNNGGNMRANKYAALALQARVALQAASISKYWNLKELNPAYVAVARDLTKMKAEYAGAYYEKAIEAAGAVINSGKYQLAGGTAPASIAAAKDNLINLFQNFDFKEGIFGRSYKSGSATTGNGIQTRGPNQHVDGYLVGTGAATLNIVDEYDYYASATNRSVAGRQVITRNSGGEDYFLDNEYWEPANENAHDFSVYKRYSSVDEPFLLKDARFQAWFFYPGTQYANTTINIQGGMIGTDGKADIYPLTNDPLTFKGETYYPYGGEAEANSAFYKITQDINATNRYDYAFGQRKSLDEGGWNAYTQTPWYDIRYAEVLLTYAEAHAESGKGDAAVAKKALNDVRRRAGFTDEVAVTVPNVLHEWKVEFPFENKWQQVLFRRRAHYDKDYTVEFMKNNNIDYAYQGRKLTVIPMIDLSGSEVAYIFPRAVPLPGDIRKFSQNGQWDITSESYYGSVSNAANNMIEQNNTTNDIVKP